MNARIAAEVFPPGDFVKEELEARRWTQADLADILGRPFRLVNEICGGKRGITPETAKGLGDAFGTGPEFWMNLESAYQLSRVRIETDAVARRAKIYEIAPVKDMVRRHWIEYSDSVEVLESRVLSFFNIEDLDQAPKLGGYAARQSTSYGAVTPAQNAWRFRARQLALAVTTAPFTEKRFVEVGAKLHTLLHSPEEIRHVPHLLAEAGIRFLVIEPLPQTRIDGACLWLDEKSPVIALSLRFDRIDCFWHTLFHGLGHLKNRDGIANEYGVLDTDIVGKQVSQPSQKPESERVADAFAIESLIPQSEVEDFISRVGPLYTKLKIQAFAKVQKVHPGIVVGQLQHRGEISYAHNREMLVKIRHVITAAALTDGWGATLPSVL